MKDEKTTVEVEENKENSAPVEEKSAIEQIRSEIKDAVNEADTDEKKEEEEKKEFPAKEKPSIPEADEKGDKSPDVTEGKPKEEKSENAVSDDLVERAIRAGMDLKTIRNFKDADALESICTKLDGVKSEKTGDESLNSGKEPEVDDIFKDLPTLDPDEYDQSVIDMFDGMKKMIVDLKKEVSSGSKTGEVNWLETKINGLGSEFEPKIGVSGKVVAGSDQAKAREKLQNTFKVLEDGYKANNMEVDRESIFEQVVGMMFGDVVKENKDAKIKASLNKRSNLHIAKPKNGKNSPTKDPLDEAAENINRKYFG